MENGSDLMRYLSTPLDPHRDENSLISEVLEAIDKKCRSQHYFGHRYARGYFWRLACEDLVDIDDSPVPDDTNFFLDTHDRRGENPRLDWKYIEDRVISGIREKGLTQFRVVIRQQPEMKKTYFRTGKSKSSPTGRVGCTIYVEIFW